ncbi:MAG: ATP-binding protein [Lachnospiraceae bacterium]|nr:ATP-binding protein [Lachnospiraceae bacterium]
MSLSNEQYESLMRDYQERRQSRNELIRERKAELYNRIPSLGRIDSEVADLAVITVRSRLFEEASDSTGETDVSKRLEALSAERARLIREAGYPTDYLDPPYVCNDCKDTGFIDGQPCHCYTQASLDLISKWDGYDPSKMQLGFDAFSLSCYDEAEVDPVTGLGAKTTAENALKEAMSFVRDFKKDRGNLLIYGETGVGKTHLSNCIASCLRREGCSVLYMTAFRLFKALEERKFGSGNTDKGISYATYDELFSCDLLIIDDLGTELSNSFTTSGLFELLNERILTRRSTVISTNLTLATIKETYAERMFSRIMEHYRMIRLYGADIRLKRKLGGTTHAA